MRGTRANLTRSNGEFGREFYVSEATPWRLLCVLRGTSLGLKMTMYSYSSEDLHALHRVLEEIIAEAKQSSPNIDVDEIIERMFDLADHGERDPGKLRAAALGMAA